MTITRGEILELTHTKYPDLTWVVESYENGLRIECYNLREDRMASGIIATWSPHLERLLDEVAALASFGRDFRVGVTDIVHM